MSESIDIVQSRQVIDMLTVANEFCHFTENLDGKNASDCFDFYQKLLPLLYLKGSLLPEIEVSDESANERFVTESHWEDIFLQTKSCLGSFDTFYSINENNQAEKTSFADQLSDIYQDMKDFLMLFQKNRLSFQENAIAECSLLFKQHWGIRCLRLVTYIHSKKFEIENEDLF